MKQLSDKELGNIFKKELPQAPINPWFVRKIMNRLPEAQGKEPYAWIERLTTGIAFAAMVAAWAYLIIHIVVSGMITMGDIMAAIVLITLGTTIAISYAVPYIRRWLREA